MTTEMMSRALAEWVCLGNANKALERIYFPYHNWEADVGVITDAGYFIEYECKISIDDWRNDFKKSRSVGWGATETKYDRILLGGKHRQFWVCCPPEIWEKAKDSLPIPSWCGIVTAELELRGYSSVSRWRFVCQRRAARLKATRLTDEQYQTFLEKAYYRYRGVRFERLQRDLLRLRKMPRKRLVEAATPPA